VFINRVATLTEQDEMKLKAFLFITRPSHERYDK